MTLVMVVDDDQDLAEMLGIVLTGAGIDVDLVSRGDEVLEVFRNNPPDLVLLDVMLPGLDGIEVCKLLRAESMVPIVMLSAKGDSHDVVRGLEAGADDYVVKPFDPVVLLARIRARLRPLASTGGDTVQIGPLTLDIVGHEVRRGAEKISLTPLEFSLLLALAQKPNLVFSRAMLLEKVWGYRHNDDTRLVNVHVQRLRSKIEDDPDNPKIVTTVRGVGYKAGQG